MKIGGKSLLGCWPRFYSSSGGKAEKNKRTNRKRKKKNKISFEGPAAKAPSGTILTQTVKNSTGIVQMKEKMNERKQNQTTVSGIWERERGTGVLFQENSNIMPNAFPIHSEHSCTPQMSVCHSIPSSTASARLVLDKQIDSQNGALKVLSSMYSFEIPSGMERSTSGEAQKVTSLKSFALGNSLGPMEEDYRALLLDLVLLRRETLLPILSVIQEERQCLAAQLRLFEKNVEKLQQVRDEIRELLEAYSAQSSGNKQ